MEFKGRTTGLRAAHGVLRRMPERVQKSILNSASGAGAREIAKSVEAAAPRGSMPSPASDEYGRLHENIEVRKIKRLPKGVSGHRVGTGHAFWGYMLEIGTVNMAAQPWYRPAVEAAATMAVNKVVRTIGRRLETESRKLAGEYRTVRKKFK